MLGYPKYQKQFTLSFLLIDNFGNLKKLLIRIRNFYYLKFFLIIFGYYSDKLKKNINTLCRN